MEQKKRPTLEQQKIIETTEGNIRVGAVPGSGKTYVLTNRIAYLSWFLYPIVLIYPFLQEEWEDDNQYRIFSVVMLAHLGFTLFMNIIYY